MRNLLSACIALILLAAAAPLTIQAQANSYVVDSLGDEPAANPAAGTGLTAAGDITLRSAMQAANVDGSETLIVFDDELFDTGPVDILIGTTLPTINTRLVIQGPGPGLLTVNSTGVRIFSFNNSPDATLQGMTISGSTNGAIRNSNTLLRIRECVVRDNDGLAIGLEGGGAIDNRNGSQLRITDSVIGPNNTAIYSGAIDNFLGSGNQIIAINTTFVGNRAGDAGAVLYNGGVNNTALFINCTITQNQADEDAGALYQEGPDGGLTIINSTIAGNSAGRFFGGMFLFESTNTLLINSIVAQNTEQGNLEVNIEGAVSPFSAHNLIGEDRFLTGITNGVNGNQIGTPASLLNPQLLPLSDYGGPVPTMLPAEGSPVIDTGTPAIPQELLVNGVTTDARGVDRLQGNAVDIGAVEVEVTLMPGDYNGDGMVTVADVTALANHVQFATAVEGDPDYNGDGVVDMEDVHDLARDIADGTLPEP